MKRIKLILPALLCCLSTLVQAQSQKEVEKQPILYERPLPAFAANMVPGQGKSLFWGKIKVKPNQVPTGFHLYSLYAPELKRNRMAGSGFAMAECHFAIDIFSLHTKPQLINRIFFVYKSSYPPTTFGMSLAWLDPEEQTMPLVVIRSFSKRDYLFGIEHFVALSEGWKEPASINNLAFGGWHASNTIGQTNRLFRGRDNLVEIQVVVDPATSDLSPDQRRRDYTFTLRWNGAKKDFVPHAENPAAVQRYFPDK